MLSLDIVPSEQAPMAMVNEYSSYPDNQVPSLSSVSLIPVIAVSYVLCSAATLDTTKSSSRLMPQFLTPSPTPRSEAYCQVYMSDFYIFIVIYGGMHIIPSFTIKFLG